MEEFSGEGEQRLKNVINWVDPFAELYRCDQARAHLRGTTLILCQMMTGCKARLEGIY